MLFSENFRIALRALRANKMRSASRVALGDLLDHFRDRACGAYLANGQVVIVNFWASWCHPCRGENPNVLKAYNQFHPKGLEIVAVSLDTKKESWLKAIAEDKLPWTQISDLKQRNEVADQFGVNSIPDNFLIDPNGVVIARGLRGEELEKKLGEIFK